ARTHRPPDLGRDDQVFPPRQVPQRPARDLLAGAQRVDVGRVEEVDAELEGALEEGPRLVLAQRPLPAGRLAGHRRGGVSVAHATEADARNGEASRAEASVFHGGFQLPRPTTLR